MTLSKRHTYTGAIKRETEVIGHERSINERLNILTYELGAITRSIIYLQSHTDIKQQRALLGNALIEAADFRQQFSMLICQMQELSGQLGTHTPTEQDLEADGMERFYDRMFEFEKWRADGLQQS
jgi:hypothetical protein